MSILQVSPDTPARLIAESVSPWGDSETHVVRECDAWQAEGYLGDASLRRYWRNYVITELRGATPRPGWKVSFRWEFAEGDTWGEVA